MTCPRYSESLCALAVWTIGCGGEIQTEVTEDELIGGTETYSRKEVGRIIVGNGSCTATLVRANVVITAAHCVDFDSSARASDAWFVANRSRGDVEWFGVRAYVSFGSDVGDDDVALARLSESVPEEFARPARLADRDPEDGERVTSYGFGCTDRDNEGQAPRKRKVSYRYPRGHVLCPGDSGGPGFLGARGALSLIHSGFWVGSGGDIHARVSAVRERIDHQLAEWN
ncbi:MAG: trypsin-like serine protease [Deltaproteobacteria bacterium]|nr:trypsin-like serine protease [Deltaproteobacteria bacterium]